MISKKKILILGGEGFIGRNLSDILSDSFECFSVGFEKSIFSGSKAKFIKLDPYKEKITGHYDIVIVLIDNPVELSQVKENESKIIKNISLISPEQIIFFSSASIYMSPESEYAKRKLLVEGIYKEYCSREKINLSILRLFNIFGPYQIPKKKGSLVANIFYNYFAQEPIEINDLNAKRDLIFSVDMARCVGEIIKRKLFGSDDLATNNMITIKDLLLGIEQILPGKLEITNKKNKEKEVCPDATSRVISYIDPTPMKEALRETANFYENNWRLIAGK